jgi:GT2 family glycosyltransferase
MTVSVVICAFSWERAADLRRAVDSVLSQQRPPDEVIVVIDHAPSLEAWCSHSLSGVRLVTNTGARGLAGARNCGVTAASGDVVAFLDDDACAAPSWLARLVAPFADERVGGTGGAVVADWRAGRPGWMPAEFDWVVGCSYRGLPDGMARVRNVIGCNMAFRRSAVVAAGGFVEGLGRVGARPLGCEETELCIRIGAAGLDIVYTPDAVVHHAVTRERSTLRYFVSRCVAEGRSKRAVTRRAGTRTGLSSERSYVARTLPAGVVGALREGEAARAATIGLGLAATAAGYVRGATR